MHHFAPGILPLVDHADCLMCTRGALRSCIPPIHNKPIALRCSAGSTVLTELNDECVGVEIEDALRLNASMMAVMVEASAGLWNTYTMTGDEASRLASGEILGEGLLVQLVLRGRGGNRRPDRR